MFISFLYMFWPNMCLSSGEIIVSRRHLVFVAVCVDDCLICIPDSHPHTATNTKCRTDTVITPDDGHIIARRNALFVRLCTSLGHSNNFS
jgi:hypothetical protein